jgi:hypothetical protein
LFRFKALETLLAPLLALPRLLQLLLCHNPAQPENGLVKVC